MATPVKRTKESTAKADTKEAKAAKRAAQIQAAIAAAVACPKCPQVTPERGLRVLEESAKLTGLANDYAK